MFLFGVRRAIVPVVVSMLLACQSLLAAPVNCGPRPIRLAFYTYGAFYFEDANGKAQGVDKEIVDALSRRSGCRFDTQLMARARIWADLASGTLDMSVSGIETPERDQFAWFAHYVSSKNYTLVFVDAAKKLRNAESFLAQPKLKFGVVRGFKHGVEQDRILEQLRAEGRVEESADFDTVFKKFKEHRVDAMFIEPLDYRYYSKRFHLQGTEIQDWAPGTKGAPAGLILSKRRFSETDAKQWRALIDSLRDDGSLKAIYSRYLPPTEVSKLLEF